MTSVERAKRLLQAKARTIALTVVPLASVIGVSAPLHASTITLDPSSCSAIPSGSGVFMITPCSILQLPTGSDGVTGIKLYGTASTTSTNEGFLALNMSTGGTASGSGGAIIPVDYDFTLSDTSGNVMNWDVYFDIAGNNGATNASGQATGTSTGGEITGSFSVNTSQIGDAFSYVLHVEAIMGAAENDTLTITVPQNSIDVNPVPASAPEPSTMGLLASALASLTWWKRRNK